jgi:hypothetical protein
MCAIRLARTRSSWLEHFPLGLRALPWACVSSDWHACTHLGLNAPRSAHTCYLGHVRPPFGTCALPLETPKFACKTTCVPSVWNARPPFGLRTLPRACAPSVRHARDHPSLCAFLLTCAHSLGRVRHPFRARALRLACAHSLGHVPPPFWHAHAHPRLCAFRLARACSFEHAIPLIRTDAPPWA